MLGVLLVEHMRGRVLGTQNAILTAAGPLGITIAAMLTEFGSVNLAAIVIAGVWAVAVLIALRSPTLRELEARPSPRATG